MRLIADVSDRGCDGKIKDGKFCEIFNGFQSMTLHMEMIPFINKLRVLAKECPHKCKKCKAFVETRSGARFDVDECISMIDNGDGQILSHYEN